MLVERVAASERYSDSKVDIQKHWGLGDLADAHRMLNYHDEVEAIQQDQMPDESDFDTP